MSIDWHTLTLFAKSSTTEYRHYHDTHHHADTTTTTTTILLCDFTSCLGTYHADADADADAEQKSELSNRHTKLT